MLKFRFQLCWPMKIVMDGKPTKHSYKNARGVIPWVEGDELPEDAIRRLRDGAPKETCIFTPETCPYIKIWTEAGGIFDNEVLCPPS